MDTEKTGSMNFDYCADMYNSIGELDIVKYCDEPTLLQLIGDLNNKTCLDLGCGEGLWTRLIKRISQPRRLVAVDISVKMIELAKSIEAQECLGIYFQLGDIYQLNLMEQFDCVVVSFLLSIAHDRHNLAEMLARIYAHLKPGGTMVIMDDHLFLQPEHFPKLPKYNLYKKKISPDPGDLKEGDTIEFRLDCQGEWLEVIETYMPKTAWQDAMQDAGFEAISWHRPKVSEIGLAKHGELYWQDYVELPVTQFITAHKSYI
jgi:ubiquinone/menaquinone biosynthesis C-methylase UbiE